MLKLSICFLLAVFLSEDYSNYASAGKINFVNFIHYFFLRSSKLKLKYTATTIL